MLMNSTLFYAKPIYQGVMYMTLAAIGYGQLE